MTIYSTGTVSVTNGSATVTGSGTAWAVGLVTGGMFSSAGVAIPIASVTDDTHLTLAYAWPGTTAAGAAYAIATENASAASVVDLNTTLSRVLVTLSLAGITPDLSGTLADRDALTLTVGNKGYLFLHAEIGVAFAFYRWTGTTWTGPFAVANATSAGVSSIVAGANVSVDNTNPAIPVISATSSVLSVAGLTGAITAVGLRDALDTAPYVADRTALKALDTTKDTVAFLNEAGRRVIMAWNAGDFSTQITADTAEGIYVKATAVASTVGAWVRVFAGPWRLEWFGGIADGSTTTTAAFNAALAVMPSTGGAIEFGVGTYAFATAPSAISKPITLKGMGVPESILSISFATGNFVTISSGICNIHDLKVTSSVTRTSGYFIKVDTIRANIHHCYFENPYKAILLTHNATLSKIAFCEIRNITPHATAFGSGGIDVGDSLTSPDPDSCTISFVNIGNDTSNHHYAGIHVLSATALTIVGCNVLQGLFSVLVEVATGCGVLNLKIDSSYLDSSTTSALYLTASGTGNITRVMATGSWFSTANQGDGVNMAAVGTGTYQGVTLVNCEASVNVGSGIKVADAKWKYVSANGCRVAQNTTAGISLVANAGDANIQNCSIGAVDGMTGNGIGVSIAAGTGTRIEIQNNKLVGNTTAISNGATGSANRIEGNEGYNPVGAAAVTTSASPYTYTAGPTPTTLYASASTSITAATQGGVSILPAATGANAVMTVNLEPNEAVVVTYTGTLTAKQMVH